MKKLEGNIKRGGEGRKREKGNKGGGEEGGLMVRNRGEEEEQYGKEGRGVGG